jgi:hypothetical protein
MQVYVHPIPPVLDVTRKMVIRYNALYKEAVKGIKGERCCCLLLHRYPCGRLCVSKLRSWTSVRASCR